MVILQYCSDKQESARKCDSKLYWKIIAHIPVCRTKLNKTLHRPVPLGTPRKYWSIIMHIFSAEDEHETKLLTKFSSKSGNIMANPRKTEYKDIIELYKEAM